MSRRAAPLPSEHDSQAAVISWWAYACKGYGLPEFALMAVPNGGARHVVVARKLKAEGVRAGVPDLFLAYGHEWIEPNTGLRSNIRGLWIEMKRRPNKPSAEQEAVILYLRQRGYHVCVCYGVDEAVKAIKAYLA